MASKPVRTKKVSLTQDVTVLAVDSNYESVTLAAFNYREKHVYPYLMSKGLSLKKLQGPMARRHYVAPEASKRQAGYLTGVGHGLANVYTGDHSDAIYEVGNYDPDEVKGKIAHFLSCQTARELGPDFVRNGCLAYFGYDENFTFMMTDSDLFFECDSEIDRAFADGLSAAQVYARVKSLFDVRISELRAADKEYLAATLEFDRDHLRCPSSGGENWGDEAAKLS